MTVDISSLTIEKALAIAVKSEIDAEKAYEKILGQVKNFILREKLQFLIKEEKSHRKIVETLYKKMFRVKEIPEADKSLTPRLSVSIDDEDSVIDLLELAVEAEKISEEFYDELAEEVEDRGAQEILQYLSRMEHGHYSLLKGELELCQQDETYYEKDGFHFDMVHIGP